MEQSTLYLLCSRKGSHPALLSQMGVFSGAVMTVNILLPPLSLFIHFIFYAYYYFTFIPDRRENKRAMAFKTSLQEAVPSFPHRGPNPDPPKSVRCFPVL